MLPADRATCAEPGSAVNSGTAVSPLNLLHLADQAVADKFGEEHQLAQAARHLITCAAEVVGLLPNGDPKAAREALGSARAAVLVTTYAVRACHDNARIT